jgi:hypothetical protein
MNSSTYHVIDLSGFQSLLQALQRRNYALIGPTIRDNTIVYEEITGVEDLPVGWGDEQEGSVATKQYLVSILARTRGRRSSFLLR